MSRNISKVAVRELRDIMNENRGKLEAEAVVKAAEAEESHLHKYFEWNDHACGHKYRLLQARSLIKVAFEVIHETGTKTNVFFSLTSDRKAGGGYRATVDILADEDLREQFFIDAVAELRRAEAKYSEIMELRPVFDSLDEVVEVHAKEATVGKRGRGKRAAA